MPHRAPVLGRFAAQEATGTPLASRDEPVNPSEVAAAASAPLRAALRAVTVAVAAVRWAASVNEPLRGAVTPNPVVVKPAATSSAAPIAAILLLVVLPPPLVRARHVEGRRAKGVFDHEVEDSTRTLGSSVLRGHRRLTRHVRASRAAESDRRTAGPARTAVRPRAFR
ncbi:hypothetical protein ACFFSW_05965 [Saccharothrix longispora]|uniref:Uncharacterized protein n=1 Tax=Saccharothrix longispora TaxID=33920 RepID=A0ABU1PTK4_9PSEU|nr:hypothetical protein [Saccharothrix longispora]MDR6593959.1 hypothetical protein [Saccharothrix longispora]